MSLSLSRSSLTSDEAKKLRELILYISEKSKADEKYGKIKLNKILLVADVHSYQLRGKTISGAQYKSLEWGPAPIGMKDILERMERDKDLAIQKISYFNKPQERPVNLRRANLAAFSGEDIALLDEVIEHCRNATGTQLSEGSHGIAWELGRRSGKPIPFAAFLFKQKQIITSYHLDKFRKLAKERSW
jgi:hypothetical protein